MAAEWATSWHGLFLPGASASTPQAMRGLEEPSPGNQEVSPKRSKGARVGMGLARGYSSRAWQRTPSQLNLPRLHLVWGFF